MHWAVLPHHKNFADFTSDSNCLSSFRWFKREFKLGFEQNSYVMNYSQMKNLIVCLMVLLTRCTENFRENCSIQSMEFITWSRLVLKQLPATFSQKGGGWTKFCCSCRYFSITSQEDILDVFRKGVAHTKSQLLKCLFQYYSWNANMEVKKYNTRSLISTLKSYD